MDKDVAKELFIDILLLADKDKLCKLIIEIIKLNYDYTDKLPKEYQKKFDKLFNTKY